MGGMVWMIALCGAGTFLLRWLPLWRARRRRGAHDGAEGVQGWLAGVGPAAIAALLVAAVWSVLGAEVRSPRVLTAVVAFGCVVGVRWIRGGGVAVPTLVGAVVYGVLCYWLELGAVD